MPEYPEVYIVVDNLNKKVKGKNIKEIEVIYKNIFYDYQGEIKNKPIKDIRQYGKYILFFIDEYVLLSHLRMEGKYFYKENHESTKHTMLIMHFTDNTYLEYQDVRKFGRFELRHISNYLKTPPLSEIAKDPYKIDKKALYNNLKKRDIKIKQALLNQKYISGIGNIYADEILFEVGISPKRKTKELTYKELENIILSATRMFDKSISLGGATIRSYSSFGKEGKYQEELKVHTKKGMPCPRCGSKIEKISLAYRGTYFCPNCQK